MEYVYKTGRTCLHRLDDPLQQKVQASMVEVQTTKSAFILEEPPMRATIRPKVAEHVQYSSSRAPVLSALAKFYQVVSPSKELSQTIEAKRTIEAYGCHKKVSSLS